MNKTGWEVENRVHFDEIVTNYDKFRWAYPQAMFDDIFACAGASAGKNALEIGAGTGKATAPILSAGYNVTAIELGENMAQFIAEKFKGNNNFSVIVAPFEEAPLPENTYDLIYAASAFHWINAEIGCPKVFRLLKQGAVFALLRNNVYTADGDPLYEALQTAYQKHYYTHYTNKKRWSRNNHHDLQTPHGIKVGFGFECLTPYGFCDVQINFYEERRSYTANEYVALMDTMADHRNLPDGHKNALYAAMKEAINAHGGTFSQNTVFTLYMGRKG
ncbi:MAG: class I SAM-dependent methyltransferase [Defluviitaleaceae bacterium]|nr:class I SAM-dependent methyltransferase [Defluviitaleaceae bacterium]MCL2274661.1 class I SAM-dependent methyltransferase [Defluviitaleaceae bacterium]MCL2275778.1 class I SAM-dependent methyltransferase [Defluviitaleaceae bacterium]